VVTTFCDVYRQHKIDLFIHGWIWFLLSGVSCVFIVKPLYSMADGVWLMAHIGQSQL